MSEETIKKNESNHQKEKETINQSTNNNPINQLFFIVSKFPNIVSVNWIHLHPNEFPKKEREKKKERAKKKEKEKKKEKKEREKKKSPKFHKV